MRQRLPLMLSASALVIALLGVTPLGRAAADAIGKSVPFASVAGFAKNSGKLNGHTSSRVPRAGQIPVVDATGKLPASIGAVGPAGQVGPAGAAGAPGVSGYQQLTRQINLPDKGTTETIQCPGGKSVLSGGFSLAKGGDFVVIDSRPISATTWLVRIQNNTGQGGSGSTTLYIVCANVTS
jgi:hypothetical protein